MAPPATKTVLANGLRFAYLEQGKGPLVLCLHGYPDTAHTWDDLLPRLASQGYRAVAPWMRGYAPTQIPADGDYHGVTLGADVLGLVDALSTQPATVIGHDWGAFAGYAAAALGPDRILKLVTLGLPHPAAIRPGLTRAWGVRHFMLYALPLTERAVRKNNFSHLDEIYQRWSPGWQRDPHELDSIRDCFSKPGAVEAALGYYRCFVRGVLSQKGKQGRRALARKIQAPTLSLGGLQDGALGPEDFAAAERFFETTYHMDFIDNAGHFLHREQPDEVAAAILDFLRLPVEAGG